MTYITVGAIYVEGVGRKEFGKSLRKVPPDVAAGS